MESSDETERKSKLDKEQLQGLLKASKLQHSDLEKLEELKLEDISEEAKKILENLGITEEMIKEAWIKSPEDTSIFKEDDRVEKPKTPEESENSFKEEIKDQSDVALAPRQEIAKILRERSLSESLITTLLKVGFTDEFLRMLKTMGFVDVEIEKLETLWNIEKDREDVDSIVSLSSSSDEYLSLDGLYLKKSLSKSLLRGIREIVAKKPYDPIEYLGHWLLNYKVCEERYKRQKEFELELMIERERLGARDLEEQLFVPIEDEEEEEYDDD